MDGLVKAVILAQYKEHNESHIDVVRVLFLSMVQDL